MPYQLGEGLLVLDRAPQAVEIRTGLFLDERPPEIKHLSGALGSLGAGKFLAHQHGHGFSERSIFLALDASKVCLGVFLRIHRIEVCRDTTHAQCAEGLDAGLLDSVENAAGIGALRGKCGMDAGIVAGQPERHGIAEAAGDRQFVGRRTLGDIRQPYTLACHSGPLVGEGHLDLAVAGDRPDTTGDRPAQRLGIYGPARPAFLVVSRSCHLSSRFRRRARCSQRFPSVRRRRRAGTAPPPASAPVRRTC